MEKLKYLIDKILKLYEKNNFSDFINNLLLIKNEAAKFDPEQMSLEFVDFLMDQNMWEVILNSFQKEPTKFDLEAASYIASDLKDILNNNKILV